MKKRTENVLQFLLMLAGFSNLLKISSKYLDGMAYVDDFSHYYVPYLLCFGIGIVCLAYNIRRIDIESVTKHNKLVIVLFSCVFATIVMVSNYSLWYLPTSDEAGHLFRNIYRLLYLASILVGSYVCFYNILCFLFYTSPVWKKKSVRKWRGKSIFIVVFTLILLVDCSVLLLCKYPGNLQTDSFSQIYQATGDMGYGNHHPFYHTLLIKMFLRIGLLFFEDWNMAVASYSIFQIVFMSMCFAYAVTTIYEYEAPLWLVLITAFTYTLMPYHIMYSFSMTKDVIFGGLMLIAIISLFRYMNVMGRGVFNLSLLFISIVGVGLFRNNGLFTVALWVALAMLILGFREKKLLVIMLSGVAATIIMKYPVLSALNVPQTDIIESMSIPLQQIGRVAVDCKDFTQKESDLVSKVIDIDKFTMKYYHKSSDPLKELIRAEGAPEEIENNKTEYLKMYLELGMRHPFTYAIAWIDQTEGYWNAGYPDWHWYDWVDSGIFDNKYNIHRITRSKGYNSLVDEYLFLFEDIPFLQLFLCMGLHFWILLIILYISIIKGDKTVEMISIPPIMLVLSLAVATPISAEFRYFYAVFCVLPFLIVCAFREDSL